MQDNKQILEELYHLIRERMHHRVEGSYTTYLLDKGEDKVCAKIGEELFEVVLAVKNKNQKKVIGELADLHYHLTVLMAQQGVSYEMLNEELEKRRNN